MEDLESGAKPISLSIDCSPRINFATAQNSVPVLRSVRVLNPSGVSVENLTLVMAPQPAFVREKRWSIDRIAAGGEAILTDLALTLDLEFLSGLNEAERGQLVFTLQREDEVLVEQVISIDVLARDEWGGVGEMANILAAFVSPNHASVAFILKTAAGMLVAGGHSGSQDGYQSEDPGRAYMLAAGIWSAVTGMGLTYAEPPKSFELVGQKVRDPQRIKDEGLATCFDTTLLFAAALEAAGLNPVVIFTEGHSFVGVWLVNKTLPATIERDVTELRKAIVAHEFVPFETTLVTHTPPADFKQAVAAGTRHLNEANEVNFDRAIDITRARSAGVRPLANHQPRVASAAADAPVVPAALPSAPDFDCLPSELADEDPETPNGRIERWQRKLLDLSLRNRLLNFSYSKQTIPFHCPDVPQLEDLLADGKRFRVISLAEESPIGDRDPQVFRRETGQDIHDEFARAAMQDKEVCVPLTGKEMSGRLTTLFRRAKSDLAEGGTNTLFLAAGFLRWKKSETEERVYRAPLLLLPVTLKRRSAQSDFYLAHHEDEIRINSTLFEFLKRDFGLSIPALEGQLPKDESGLDLPQIFELMRQAVREVPGFEVVEELALSTFSFAKYLMWKDLVDRTDKLRENRLVKHLIDNPEKAFEGTGTSLPSPEEIDCRYSPADLKLPLPADSSQMSAVVAAAEGHDFVVVGPPGTGKSQTIANMIAHCLSIGRSVLFVAEKSAALDVVHRRLKHYGLGDACLELHSSKADRRSVIGQLGASWARRSKKSEKKWVEATSELKLHRDKLNTYVDALHKRGTHGFSVYQAIGLVGQARSNFKLTFAGMDAHDEESYKGLEELAEHAERTYAMVRDCAGLESIGQQDWSYGWEAELMESSELLTRAADTLEEKARSYQEGLACSLGDDPSLQLLETLHGLAQASVETAAGDYQVALDPEFDRLAASMSSLEDALGSVRKEKALLSATYDDKEVSRIPIDSVDRDWREASSRMWPFSAFGKRKTRKLLQTYAASGQCDPETDIAPLRTLQESLESVSNSALSGLPDFNGVDTDPQAMKGYLGKASKLRDAIDELGRMAESVAELSRTITPLLQGGGDKAALYSISVEFEEAHSAFQEAKARHERQSGGSLTGNTLSKVKDELAGILAEKEHLANWTKWVEVRAKTTGRELGPLIERLVAGDVPNAVESFRAAYFTWWLPLALDAVPELRKFAHWEHSALIVKFRELVEEVQALAAQQVCRAIVHDLPKQDRVPKKSELGVLRHQMGLQRPSISIRDLIGSMPETVTKLAPCVLMSPLSVAQYLPTDHSLFDIVIFDEASQITTWDAVGSIARGKQSVIVGDPKQLPPMNFFGRSNEDDAEELEMYERDLASILDEASASGLPNLQLNWHYRSRDESLIAFSNHHYYGNRLITFPSPETASNAVCFHGNEGVYARGSGGTNEIEARAICAFAVERLKQWITLPEEERLTLGVITFNIHQQELILDLLDEARRESPDLEWFFDDEREEPLIVKNLENIQGDERDIMLFSITFGPDSAGKMSMNFGAINTDGGEKRLNVAVTRARAELHVFSSIKADMIDLGRTKARGVADLKNFLDYAERGPSALPSMDMGSLGPTENIFEEGIKSALEARGWELRTQIGVSGYRIDLAVVHPERAGAYLAGIECDGATYHSSASARDRDKIREGVLTNLGWSILRIWSTDWFKNPKDAIDRTDSALRELLGEVRKGESEPFAEAEDVGTSDSPAALVAEAPTHSAEESEPDQIASTLSDALPLSDSESTSDPEAPKKVDPDLFFDASYDEILTGMIAVIVERDGPLRDECLVREISRAHGWKRTGTRIRKRVTDCLGANEAHAECGTLFVWAPGTHSQVIPYREDLDRSPRDIPRAEIFWLLSNGEGVLASDDPPLALARKLGIGRLSQDARAFLGGCLTDYEDVNAGQ